MPRPRVEGVGDRIGRQVSGGGGSNYTSTRDSRIQYEGSGFDLLSKGLSSTADALYTFKRQEKLEQLEVDRASKERLSNLQKEQAAQAKEVEKLNREKATVLARTGKDEAYAAISAYILNNPDAANIPPEQLLAENEEVQAIYKNHLNPDRVPFEDILFQAHHETISKLNVGYQEHRGKKIKQFNVGEAYKFLSTETKKDSFTGNPKAVVSKTKELFNLSDEEVSEIFLGIQQDNLKETTLADVSIAKTILEQDLLPPEQQAKFKSLLVSAQPLLEQRNKQEKGVLALKVLPQALAEGKDIEAMYLADDPMGKMLKAHFTAAEIKAFKTSYESQQEEQYNLYKALESWTQGTITEFYDGEFSISNEEKMRQLEELATEAIYKKDPRYLQAKPEEQADVLTQLQIEGAQANNVVPFAMAKQVRNALSIPEKGFASMDEVPMGFRRAFDTALKLDANGMLGVTLNDSRDSLAYRAIVHLTNHGEDLLGSINRVARAKEENPSAFSIDYKSVDNVAQNLKDSLKPYFKDGYNALPSITKAASKLYNINRALGLTVEEARDLTVKQMKDDYIATSGGLLNRKALVGLSERTVMQVSKKLLDTVASNNPHLDRSALFLTEMKHGHYAVTNEDGTIVRTKSNDPNSMYTFYTAYDFTKEAQKMKQASTSETIKDIQEDIQDNLTDKPSVKETTKLSPSTLSTL